MYKDNKGYSMLELIIILALMAILGGVLVYSFSLVTGQYARECANNLSTTLDKTKNYAFTKSASSDMYVEISLEDEGYVATYYVPDNPINATAQAGTSDYVMLGQDTIGKKNVEITCHFEDGSEHKLSEAASIRIYYDRISGAFKEAVKVTGSGETSGFCNSITVEYGKIYELIFYSATGKHTLERIN